MFKKTTLGPAHGLVLIAAAIFLPFSMKAVHAASALGHMSIEIVSPITLSEDTVMNFGAISTGIGTVTISSDGVLTSEGVSIMSNAHASEGVIRLAGASRTSISLSMTLDSYELNSSVSGATPIIAKNFMINGEGAETTLTLEDDVPHLIPIGATLEIEEQPAGSYSGEYMITANYE